MRFSAAPLYLRKYRSRYLSSGKIPITRRLTWTSIYFQRNSEKFNVHQERRKLRAGKSRSRIQWANFFGRVTSNDEENTGDEVVSDVEVTGDEKVTGDEVVSEGEVAVEEVADDVGATDEEVTPPKARYLLSL